MTSRSTCRAAIRCYTDDVTTIELSRLFVSRYRIAVVSHRFCREKKENNRSGRFDAAHLQSPRSSRGRSRVFLSLVNDSAKYSNYVIDVMNGRRGAKHDNCAEECVIVPRCAKESGHVIFLECSNFTSLISQLTSLFSFLRDNRSTEDPDRSVFFASFRSSTANFARERVSEVSKQVTWSSARV